MSVLNGARRCRRRMAANPPDSVAIVGEPVAEALVGAQCAPDPEGVADGLLAGHLGALLEQRRAGEGVGDDGQRHRGDEGDEPEEQGDLGAQAHRTAGPRQVAGHAASVAGQITAAGEAPGGGRHPTGAA